MEIFRQLLLRKSLVSTLSAMVRVVSDFPTVENTELLSIHARLSPQQISTEDRYLLAYASNTWRLEIPNCVYHPPSSTIIAPFQIQTANGDASLTFPFDSTSSMNIIKTLVPETNTITLGLPSVVYFLAENLLIHLPTTAPLGLSNDDGLIFSIPYTQIIQHCIRDNLTKLQLMIKGDHDANTNLLVMYPLQRYPPQPLANGIFAVWANQTPLEALHYVSDSIGRGRDLAQMLLSSDYDGDDIMDDPIQADTMLTSEGQADDEDFQFNAPSLINGGMNVTLIGGSNVSGMKRFRASDDSLSTPVEHRANLGPGARPKRNYVPRVKRQ